MWISLAIKDRGEACVNGRTSFSEVVGCVAEGSAVGARWFCSCAATSNGAEGFSYYMFLSYVMFGRLRKVVASAHLKVSVRKLGICN